MKLWLNAIMESIFTREQATALTFPCPGKSEPNSESHGKTFNVPVVLDSKLRDRALEKLQATSGYLCWYVKSWETLRFDELAVKMDVRGSGRYGPLGMPHVPYSQKGKAFFL